MRRKRELFGGVIWSAGFAATAAVPAIVIADNPTFEFAPEHSNYIGAGIKIIDHFYFDYEVSLPGMPAGSVSYSYTDVYGATLTAYATLTESLMRVEASGAALYEWWGPLKYVEFAGGTALINAWLAPTTDTTIRIKWNNIGTQDIVVPTVVIRDAATDDVLLDITGVESGNMTFVLEAGEIYRIRLRCYTDVDDFDGHSWAQIVIVPAPGACLLLGSAVLLGRRRRRL